MLEFDQHDVGAIEGADEAAFCHRTGVYSVSNDGLRDRCTCLFLSCAAVSPLAIGPAAAGVPPATLPAAGAPVPAGTTQLPEGIIRVAGGRFADDNCREFTFSGWNQCVPCCAPSKSRSRV